MSLTIDRKREERIWFNQEQRNQLKQLFDLVDQAFMVMSKNLTTVNMEEIDFKEVLAVEQLINTQRDEMRRISNESMHNEGFNVYSTLIYNNLLSALERVGDHIHLVSRAIGEQQ